MVYWLALIFLYFSSNLHCDAIDWLTGLYDHVKKNGPAADNLVHKVVFAVQPQQSDELRSLFEETYNPSSSSYRKFWTREALAGKFSNIHAVDEIVAYLVENGMNDYEVNRFGDFVTVYGSVKELNSILNAQFHVYEVAPRSGLSRARQVRHIIRAEDYEIPLTLRDHVYAVFNVNQFPSPSEAFLPSMEPILDQDDSLSESALPVGMGTITQYITPLFLYSHYNIFANESVGSFGSQCVYSTIEQYFSPADLQKFQQNFGLPQHPVDEVVTASDGNTYSSDSACTTNAGNCIEANLDVQYLMGVAPYTWTQFSYDAEVDFFLLNWIVNMSSLDDPPLVVTISYGILEYYLDSSFVNAFDSVAMMLGLQGVTIVAASGDDGAPGYNARSGSRFCGYYPLWPASSPYVMSLGATMGPESDSEETACMATKNGRITTGGGFSTLYSQPQWQINTVNTYFDTVSKQPAKNYNAFGRAYPDVSLLGYNYKVLIGGNWYSVSGTSASAPVFAGMVSLVNAARLAKGWTPLGWLNRELYTNSSNFTTDIISGSNLCTGGTSSSAICCSQGFYASEGWDPVTGFGSINFELFYNYFTTVQSVDVPNDQNGAAATYGYNLVVLLAPIIGAIFSSCY